MRIEEKPWESEVFGVRCGEVYCNAYNKTIDFDGWDFLHARPGIGEADCIAILKEAGFWKVTDYMMLRRNLCTHPPATSEILFPYRKATEGDAEHVGDLAAHVFIYDRFRADPHISREAAEVLERTRGENLCRGYAESVFVAIDLRYGIIGFSSVRGSSIGLNGVHPWFRHRGIGFGLVELACERLVDLGCKYALMDTQRSNTPALNMYFKKCHFKIQGMAIDFHWVRPGLEWHDGRLKK